MLKTDSQTMQDRITQSAAEQSPVTPNAASASASTAEFIDDLASLLAPWGVPATAGRLYALLMLSDTPVSLDDISTELGMSRAGAWNAAKFLENSGNIRRFSERGSKKVYFRRIEDIAPCQAEQMRALGAVGRLLLASAPKLTQGSARDRLERTGHFCVDMERMIAEAYEQYRTEHNSA